MKAVATLPEGYREFYTIDLQKNVIAGECVSSYDRGVADGSHALFCSNFHVIRYGEWSRQLCDQICISDCFDDSIYCATRTHAWYRYETARHEKS